ncbi:MAG: TDP-N-acetylfucosamine:lipid II N-acetylfucosaminyltransferase [Eubacteriales bacterium]|nr:TDP-N-acetylfucosamine:lipid II N-acetylfucosaminyltransferase [Eubacteriales bacterium]
MILHIFNDQKKFSKPFFGFLVEHSFDLKEHFLIHYGKKDEWFGISGINNFFIPSFISIIGNIRMLFYLFKADKIIINCLASPALILYLAVFPNLCKKSYWLIWGKDLYFFRFLEKIRWYHQVYEFFRKIVIRRIKYICTLFNNDYLLAKEWYNAEGELIPSILPFGLKPELFRQIENDITKDRYNIVIGNSASLTNNHEDIFAIMKGKISIDKIYCPLSYGGKKKYVNKIKDLGEKLFGNHFYPLIDFMDSADYFKFLDSVDIAIYNHHRQEAGNNIFSMILMCKTVYLDLNTSVAKFLVEQRIVIKDIKELENSNLEVLPRKILNNNAKILRELYNEKNLIKTMKTIFNK